jgi:hypothetical protein
MAGHGPAPKPNRRRRNIDTYADVQTRLTADGPSRMRGPTLSKATCGVSDEWEHPVHALVEAWWATWRRSPLTEAWLDTDWQRLAMLAPLVASYHERPHHLTMAEIRQNESLLGATHVDRLKARIKVEPREVEAPKPGVTALDDYRARLA